MTGTPLGPMVDPRESIRPAFELVAEDGAGNRFELALMPRMTFPPAPPQIGIRIKGPLLTMVVGLDDDMARTFFDALAVQIGRATS